MSEIECGKMEPKLKFIVKNLFDYEECCENLIKLKIAASIHVESTDFPDLDSILNNYYKILIKSKNVEEIKKTASCAYEICTLIESIYVLFSTELSYYQLKFIEVDKQILEYEAKIANLERAVFTYTLERDNEIMESRMLEVKFNQLEIYCGKVEQQVSYYKRKAEHYKNIASKYIEKKDDLSGQ